jgi:predicted transcriptional regulator
VKHTSGGRNYGPYSVEETSQNGVKSTHAQFLPPQSYVEDAIQNGVKEINHVDVMKFFNNKMEKALQNGIKETKSMCGKRDGRVNNTIENGVKDTLDIYSRCEWEVKHAIKNGVRHVEDGDWLDQDDRVEEIIQNGVKS